jgi:acetyl esterase/lipase
LTHSADQSAPIDSCVHVPSQVPIAIQAELARLARVVAPQPTEALYAPMNECEPYSGLLVRRDVSYGADTRNLLDLFVSDHGQSLRPVLVFVHGGAFMRGDRRIGNSPFNDNIAIWAARNGLLGVNITYRLAPEHPWPAAQYDIRSALEWLRTNASKWSGDASQIYLMGHSAGAAHVAQYLAFPRFHLDCGPGLKGAVMLSGIYDPSSAESNPPLRAYFGEDASRYSSMSAVSGLCSSAVPQLYAYAELDPEDFVRQAHQLKQAMLESKGLHVMHELRGHSHMSEIYSINTTDDSFTKVLQAFMNDSGGALDVRTST